MAEEPGDAEFQTTLDAASLQKAKDELNERNDKDRLIAVQTFRKWLLEQDWIKTPTDFKFLLRFLRAKKFSQLEARKRIENYWKTRTLRSEWFTNNDPTDPLIQRCLRQGVMCCPKKVDKHGRKVLIGRIGNFTSDFIKEVGLTTFYKAMIILYDWVAYDENAQVNGIVTIADYSGLTMQLFTAFFNPDVKRDFMGYFQNGLPVRVKSINAYHEPAFFDMIWTIVSPMMSKKIKDRFRVHGRSLVNIYKEVGYECLPDEYLPDDYEGKSAGSCNTIVDEMVADMSTPDFRDYIRELSSDKYGVDKSRIPAKQQETASYRKLNVD